MTEVILNFSRMANLSSMMEFLKVSIFFSIHKIPEIWRKIWFDQKKIQEIRKFIQILNLSFILRLSNNISNINTNQKEASRLWYHKILSNKWMDIQKFSYFGKF